MNRRKFILNSSAVFALSALQHPVTAAFSRVRLPYRVALIGTGWYGKSDLFRLMQVAHVEVAGLCDVDNKLLEEAAELVAQKQGGKKPAMFRDYRKMLSTIKPEIVLIATPDHWHALQAIDSIESGAHVYVQKPISVDVLEGEAILAAARKFNRVVQVGTQRKSTPHLIEAKQSIVDAGLLGKIGHVEMYCYYHMRHNGNPEEQPVPDFFDYDLWTGPAPLRPYTGLPHVRWWRTFMEYGNGIMGDMCVHMFDTVRWMLNLGWPEKISSTGGIFVQQGGLSNISDTQVATFDYPGLKCVWQHRTWGTAADPEYPWGFTLYGEKGTLRASTFKYDFTPAGDGQKIHGEVLIEKEKYPEDLKEKDIELHAAPATRKHMTDFLQAIETKSRPVADIEEGHISSASCILANLSMQLNRPLRYDPVQKLVVNDPEATGLLQRKYRKPWIHPFKS